MATPPLESTFKKKVRKKLSEIDQLYFFVKEAASLRGIPDIVGCYKGKFFAWELKKSEAESKKKSPRHALQKYTIGQIQNTGGIASFVYPENLEEKLEELLSSSNI